MKRACITVVTLLSMTLGAMAQDAFVPTPGYRDTPTSPTLVTPYGDVLVTASTGLPSVPPLPPAYVCAAVHASCPIGGVSVPGQVCECFVPGIGSESGITR